MTVLQICHDAENGTFIKGLHRRNKDTAELLHSLGNWWSCGKDQRWHLAHSKHHNPHIERIEQARDALAAAGYDVEIRINRIGLPTKEHK